MEKKATLTWDEIAKWVFVLILLIILLIFIAKSTGILDKLWEQIKGVFRY